MSLIWRANENIFTHWVQPTKLFHSTRMTEHYIGSLNWIFMNTATVANRCFTVCRLSGIGPMKETGMNDVIIRHDGTVTMSGLVKADFGCSLNFKRFPFDTQLCKFYFGTLSLTNNEIQFNNTAINMAHSTISQGNSVYNITQIRVRNKIKSVPIAMYICMRLWIKYNPTTRLPDYPPTRLPDYPTARLLDCPTSPRGHL